MKEINGITLIALVITIIVLLVLSGITINFALVKNGLLYHVEFAKEEDNRQKAIETMNLKITSIQIKNFSKYSKLPTLQYLADSLCEDDEIEYVLKESKKFASINKISVNDTDSFFTKLKDYPYEFEINSFLELASIDGVSIPNTISKEIEKLQNELNSIKEENKQLKQEIENLKNKKSGVRKILLGTYNTTVVNTIDVSSYEGYENFTIDNFALCNVGLTWVNRTIIDNVMNKILSDSSYNPETGILTTNRTGDAGDGWTRYINFSVYLLDGKIETIKE